MFTILLVDDDPVMRLLVDSMLQHVTDDQYEMVYVQRCSDALNHVNSRCFDLILLDNRLSRTVTAQATVPMFRRSAFQSPIAIISSDVSADYLSHPSILGVSHIVDKSQLCDFIRKQIVLAGLVSYEAAE
ncbi:MAG: response regulator [Pseudomonadota bacterium]